MSSRAAHGHCQAILHFLNVAKDAPSAFTGAREALERLVDVEVCFWPGALRHVAVKAPSAFAGAPALLLRLADEAPALFRHVAVKAPSAFYGAPDLLLRLADEAPALFRHVAEEAPTSFKAAPEAFERLVSVMPDIVDTLPVSVFTTAAMVRALQPTQRSELVKRIIEKKRAIPTALKYYAVRELLTESDRNDLDAYALARSQRLGTRPAITSALQGRRVEVCREFPDEDEFYWCPGTIGEVSDAETRAELGREVGIESIYVCYDEFEEGFANLEAAWLDVSRVASYMADDEEGAWRFLKDDDDEIALDDPAPEDRATMDSGDGDDDDDDDMDEDDD
jgi:hypothetical protein